MAFWCSASSSAWVSCGARRRCRRAPRRRVLWRAAHRGAGRVGGRQRQPQWAQGGVGGVVGVGEQLPDPPVEAAVRALARSRALFAGGAAGGTPGRCRPGSSAGRGCRSRIGFTVVRSQCMGPTIAGRAGTTAGRSDREVPHGRWSAADRADTGAAVAAAGAAGPMRGYGLHYARRPQFRQTSRLAGSRDQAVRAERTTVLVAGGGFRTVPQRNRARPWTWPRSCGRAGPRRVA